MSPNDIFLKKPKTDFAAVRDGRQSPPLWLDIDLSAARSISAGTALSINIAGNSFYVDADTTNVGYGTIHFQDTNLSAQSAPLFVAAGFIANVAFTQILIENPAQVGKRLRIFYGVDIDFQAGVNASIAITGNVGITGTASVAEQGNQPATHYGDVATLGAGGTVQVFAAAANTNGATIHEAHIATQSAGNNILALIAKATAPANAADGRVILLACGTGGNMGVANRDKPIKIPAGFGLYFFNSSNAELAGQVSHSVGYTLN
jgi:hypothetical protein